MEAADQDGRQSAPASMTVAAAAKAVEVIVGQLKDKLPEPIAGQIEGLLSGDGDDGDGATGAGDVLGGIGKKLGL